MKVLDKKTINYLLSGDFECMLCIDKWEYKIYICDKFKNRLYAVRYDTYVKIDLKKFYFIYKGEIYDYYSLDKRFNNIWKD